MTITQEILLAGGTVDDQGQAYAISYWHIPNGTDYDHAIAHKCFIDDKEVADKIASSYDPPPEMAVVLTRAQIDEVQLQMKKQKG